MLGFCMIAIGCAGAIKPAGPRWLPFTVAAATLCCAVLLRHNAIFAAMLLIVLCLYRLRTNAAFRIPISVAGSVFACVLLLLATASFNASLAKVHREPWAWIALFNIAGVIEQVPDRAQQQAIYDAVPAQLRGDGLDAVLASYSPRYVLTLFNGERPGFACATEGNGGPPSHHLSPFEACFEMSDITAHQLRTAWLETIAQHPWAWLMHRTAVFREVIGATSDPLWDPIYFAQVRGVTVPEEALRAVYGGDVPAMNRVQAGVAWRLESLAETIVYRPWLYLMIAIAVVAGCLWRRDELTLQIAMIAASGLTHEAGLFLLAPSADYRYSHCMIYAAVLSGALLLRAGLGVRAADLSRSAKPLGATARSASMAATRVRDGA